MEEGIQNYSQTVMFPGTPCIQKPTSILVCQRVGFWKKLNNSFNQLRLSPCREYNLNNERFYVFFSYFILITYLWYYHFQNMLDMVSTLVIVIVYLFILLYLQIVTSSDCYLFRLLPLQIVTSSDCYLFRLLPLHIVTS